MKSIKLEYRFSLDHLSNLNITPPENETCISSWSYARHLSSDWNLSKIAFRKSAVTDLLANLDKLDSSNQTIDLNPLKKDQRISGVIYGKNPLQNMYNIIEKYAEQFPEQEFYGKWGGSKHKLPGKGFAFYVDNEEEANITKHRLTEIASSLNVPINAQHTYGIIQYQQFVTIDNSFKSKIKNKEEFRDFLIDLKGYPHFAHYLFVDC